MARVEPIIKNIRGFNCGMTFSDIEDYKLSILQIPKCGSNSIGNVFYRFGRGRFQQGVFQKKPETLTIAIVREPLDRLVSGICTIAKNGQEPEEIAQIFLNYLNGDIVNNTVLDCHIVPMYEYLYALNPVDLFIPISITDKAIPDIVWNIYNEELEFPMKNKNAFPEHVKTVKEMLLSDDRVNQYLELDYFLWEKACRVNSVWSE